MEIRLDDVVGFQIWLTWSNFDEFRWLSDLEMKNWRSAGFFCQVSKNLRCSERLLDARSNGHVSRIQTNALGTYERYAGQRFRYLLRA
ncbi:hypothetical protein CEXT_303191 [Caerostris extrusa]|uniref:Uncharacterized protein n=1 Tax=Caerostris extrusa TaxID=172846 RepID=A0AAV4MD16_CAEEX|nr:hypothetical protein CEXT_303191 [Caerostris extrusa]